jgi:hypothetical protein
MLARTFIYKGHKCDLYYEDTDFLSSLNPRQWDSFGVIVTPPMRNYRLGDCEKSTEEIQWIMEHEAAAYLPLRIYDHSGISLSYNVSTYPYNDRYDSSPCGIIYVTKEDILREFSCKKITKKIKEKALSLLKSEVDTYDRYLTGEVYRYEIGNLQTGDLVESVGGYIGDPYSLEEECRVAIDHIVADKNKQDALEIERLILNLSAYKKDREKYLGEQILLQLKRVRKLIKYYQEDIPDEN